MSQVWVGGLAQCPKTDQTSNDQVDSDEVIEKPRKNEDEDPRYDRYDGREIRDDGHSHSLVLPGDPVLCC